MKFRRGLCLFLILVQTFWPDGAALIREAVFLPGQAVAVSALNDLAEELYAGTSLTAAFADFTRKLLP